MFARGAIVALMARGALGGGFDLKNIGKAVEKAQKDNFKVPDAIHKGVKQMTEDPGKVVKGSALDTAKDAVQSATANMPTVSIVAGGGGGKAAPAPELPESTASPTESAAPAPELPESLPEAPVTAAAAAAADPPTDQAEKVREAVKGGPLNNLLRGKGFGDTVKGLTAGKVVEAVARTDPSKIEEAAGQVVDHGQKIAEAAQDASVKELTGVVGAGADAGAAVGQAFSQAAKGTLEKGQGVVDAMKNPSSKAMSASMGDMMKLDGAKKGLAAVSGTSLGSLSQSVSGASRQDVQNVVKDPARAIKNIGRTEAADGAKDAAASRQEQQDEPAGGFGVTSLMGLLLLGCLVLCGYMFFQHFTKPRPVGMPMLSGDSERDSIMMTSHWMGSNAREVIASSQGSGNNAAGFTRF